MGELGTSARSAIMPSVSEGVMNRAERSLLDAVAAGELDEHLDALAAAVSARQQLLHTVRSATRLMSLCEGDIVRINGRISPRYLAGLQATVLDIDHAAATVQLERPVGRFGDGRVRVPALALEKLSPTPEAAWLRPTVEDADRQVGTRLRGVCRTCVLRAAEVEIVPAEVRPTRPELFPLLGP